VLRLVTLIHSSYAPVAELAAKMRREETYHLLHFDIWLKRLVHTGAARA
jgi:ring-1,2-phenylacetyl-CoA epoxidase subunit PaaC